MFIISNYTINLIGYPGKYHACEIEAATKGSSLTTPAYYLVVLRARHSVGSQAPVEVGWDCTVRQATGPSNRANGAARWGRRELDRWGQGFPSETPEAFRTTPRVAFWSPVVLEDLKNGESSTSKNTRVTFCPQRPEGIEDQRNVSTEQCKDAS